MNRSLAQKSAARLAAAQLLYQQAITGEALNPEAMAVAYREYQEDSDVAPNAALLKKLLEGVRAHQEALEPQVEKAIMAGWKKERMSPLLLAILRLAAFELAHCAELKTAIVINEYVSLAARFFGPEETGFANAAINAMAASLRHG